MEKAAMTLRIEIRGRRPGESVCEMIRRARTDNSIGGWMYACEEVAKQLGCFVYYQAGIRADLKGHEIVAVFHGGVNL